MGKRSADRQLTQLNQYDGDTDAENNSDVGEGTFRMADKEVLSTRQIKMPKSRFRNAEPNAAAASVFSQKPTAGAAAAQNPFFSLSSSPSSSTAAAAGASAAASGEGDGGKSALFKGFSFGSQQPAAAAAAAPAAKGGFTMTSFKPPASGTSTTSGTPGFSVPAGLPFASTTTTSKDASFSKGFVPPSAPLSYADKVSSEAFYKSIRGLNVSLVKKVGDAVKANAFVDLTPLLEQYAEHWRKINQGTAVVAAADGTKKAEEKQGMDADAPKEKPVVEDKPVEAKVPATTGFNFGTKPFAPAAAAEKPATTGFNLGKAVSPSSTEKPVTTGFSFGKAVSPSSNANTTTSGTSGFSFSFGKPAGGQSEASPSKDAEKKPFSFEFTKPAEPSTTGKPSFSFGLNTSTSSTTTTDAADAAAATSKVEDSDGDDDQADEPKKEPSTAGEEGETTEHLVRSKLYQWDSETKQYKDLGINNFKINSSVVTDSGAKRARILCRQDGSDRVTLNASIFKDMNVEMNEGKKDVGLMVFVDGKPCRFLVRVRNAEFAKALYEALEKVRKEI
ncbi:hypothetical protein LPJ66_002369 [Kickxella alabastrina]|uniref:Uncharacterized protein n=1 Tax=Kickxella alabastrina TaxID=61397 RepID=A0ACC1IQN4_9FUNG|nr:hypothetical protein LPJ66_002369 [Kickxella alabastrina]